LFHLSISHLFMSPYITINGPPSRVCRESPEPIRQLEDQHRARLSKSAKHGEVSLSEIDDICGPINEHESKRDQGINTADAEAGEEELESYVHRHGACSGSAASPPPPRKFLYSLKSICLMNTILPLSFLTML
jgi:hypothetical protein